MLTVVGVEPLRGLDRIMTHAVGDVLDRDTDQRMSRTEPVRLFQRIQHQTAGTHRIFGLALGHPDKVRGDLMGNRALIVTEDEHKIGSGMSMYLHCWNDIWHIHLAVCMA